MHRLTRISPVSLLLALGLASACSDSGSGTQNPGPMNATAGASGASAGQTAVGMAGQNASGAGGSAGSVNAAGGDTMAGASAGGAAAGGGGMMSMTGGQAGASMGGAGGTGAMPYSGPFTCTEYIGAYLSMEWYLQHNFEDKLDALGVAGATGDNWQLKWHHHGDVTQWNDPNSPFWSNDGDPNDDNAGAPIQSACAQNSDSPDRVIILTFSWELLTEEAWLPELNKLIETIQLKRPNAKRIELMPLIRCPDNQMCNPNADYGPDANGTASRQDCYVLPEQDSAMATAIAAHSDIAALGPVLEATMCNPSHDGAHLTGDDNEIVAQEMAQYASENP